MDTFIDKLAHKRNAQEMIRANSAAEAAKMEQMQVQIKEYDELMQEIRRVNIKTAENVDNMRTLLAQCLEKLESVGTEEKPKESVQEQLAVVKNLLEEQVTSVRGLLEEQTGSVRSLLEEQTGSVRGLLEEQSTSVKGLLEERITQTEDFVHKENVKVYRNVQASFTEEMEKQNQQEGQNRTERESGAPRGLSVVILIAVIVDILINLIPMIF